MQIMPITRSLTAGAAPTVAGGGLAALNEVVLDERHQCVLNEAVGYAGGTAAWRQRKAAEARDLLALSQLAPGRLRVDLLDLSEALRALLVLRVPVACRSEPDGELIVASEALLGLTYPAEALRSPLPGPSVVQILSPGFVWHANVARGPIQMLCLGPSLPAGSRIRELVLMTYGALSMQTAQVDERDPAGVMNYEAALWWQQNLQRVPLSKEPFLSPAGTHAPA